jgi:hypothetical protein
MLKSVIKKPMDLHALNIETMTSDKLASWSNLLGLSAMSAA